MGIHTGEAAETPTGLVGYEVHRAARIGAVAHGGQVLLSASAAGLVEDALPRDVVLRDLGSHRLKDLGRPESLFQLVADGLRDGFPPLRSLDNPELPNNLPVSLSPFVGRHDELAQLVELIESSRLVTLTGAGGAGKTRLALQAAAEVLNTWEEGVWFIEFASIMDPELVSSTVSDSLGINDAGKLTDLDALLRTLKDQHCLLVLDNCEHLIDAIAKLADLIARNCSKVSIIATSREPLGVDGEKVYRIPSLSLPSRDVECADDLHGSDAADLFIARTRLGDDGFVVTDMNADLVAAVCRRLDGIPLAIELAAARLSSMSLQDLHERLDQRFRLLTGGSRNALPRQQTLGAMVAWSYDLLADPEREVLRRLTVFVDGFTLEAAEAVCATRTVESFDVPAILGSLVNKSLVVADRRETSLRYRLLETIRQFAAEQLLEKESDEAVLALRQRHAEYFLALCEEAAPAFRSRDELQWFARLNLEWDNVIAAFKHFSVAPRDACNVLRLGWACGIFAPSTSRSEPTPFLEDALANGIDVPPDVRAKGLLALLALDIAVPPRGEAFDQHMKVRIERSQEAAELARSLDDLALEALATAQLAVNSRLMGDVDGARQIAERSVELARRVGDAWLLGHCLLMAARIQVSMGDRQPFLEESLAAFRRAGTIAPLASVLLTSSFIAADRSDVAECINLCQEAVEVAETVGSLGMLRILWNNLGFWECAVGNVDEARRSARRSLMAARRLGSESYGSAFAFFALAWCAEREGDTATAAQLYGFFDHLIGVSPENMIVWVSWERGFCKDLETRLRTAIGEAAFERAIAVSRDLHYSSAVALALQS